MDSVTSTHHQKSFTHDNSIIKSRNMHDKRWKRNIRHCKVGTNISNVETMEHINEHLHAIILGRSLSIHLDVVSEIASTQLSSFRTMRGEGFQQHIHTHTHTRTHTHTHTCIHIHTYTRGAPVVSR